MSELDNLFNQYVSGGKAENKPTRAEFKPLILDDDTQDVDVNKKDQQTIPQYVDVDKVSEQQFVQPERRSYFVAGNVNNNEINTTAQKPNEIEYEANTIDDEKKKDDYFALTKLSTNKKDIVKNAIKYITGATNPIQSAINTVGAFTGKDDKEIVLEGVRGFTGSTIDFASNLYRFFKQNTDIAKTYTKEQLDKIANLGNVMTGGESFANDIAEQYTEFYKQIDEENKILRDKTERFLQYTGIAKTDKDGFIYDLVGGGASLMYAIGLAAITKSPAAAAEMFGMYQYQSLYEEGIDRGFSPIKARAIGVAGGAFEGGLEMVGLHVLIETLKARRSFTKILKAALTEFTQEASQQGAEEILAKLSGLREDSTVGQIISNVFYAGVIGAILGGGSATVSNVFYKQISDSATRELINNGMQSDYAKQMVDNVLKLSVSPQAAQEVVSISKDEQSPVTYKNADPRETYKETGEAIKKALDPAQKRGVELEFIDEKKKFTDTVANALINSGRFTQEEAYKQAEAQANLADGLARIGFEQDNIRPSEYYKRFKVDVTSGNIETDERNIDEENPFVDVSFDPIDFDPQARAEYEAAMDAQQEEIDKFQKEFTMSLKDHAKFFSEIGIEAIRRPTPDGVGKDRWGEYKDLSPRIKNYFFSDDATMSWDDVEKLLAESSSNIKDLFEYLTKADETAKTYNQKEIFNKVLAKEKEDIKQKAIADGTFLKAPNGKDSNLPEQLWLTVRTKAFKSWFGDWINDPQNASKVVDENGEPLVVYHGTKADFSVFEGQRIANTSEGAGFYFTPNKNLAQGFGNVKAVFLNIRNPQYAYGNIDLVSDTYEEDYEKENKEAIDKGLQEVKKKLEKKGYKFYKQVQKDLFDVIGAQTQEVLDGLLYLRNFVENENFDEEKIYNDIREAEKEVFKVDGYTTNRYGGDQKVYVVFMSNQIKSINNRGSFDKNNPDIYYQPAYHGTPYKFDSFSTKEIGSGEGAQAHGWGLYFAENKDIAEKYRKNLIYPIISEEERYGIGTQIKIGNRIYKKRAFHTYENEEHEVADIEKRWLNDILNWIEVKNGNKENILKGMVKDEFIRKSDHEEIKKFITNNNFEIIKPKSKTGQVYKVDIPDNDTLLDEDKTFQKQPERVKKALSKLLPIKSFEELKNKIDYNGVPVALFGQKQMDIQEIYEKYIENPEKYAEYFYGQEDGRTLYQRLSDYYKGDRQASLKLNEAGIKGITYDGQQDGRAYVVFDDKAVKVLEKYYQQQQQEQPRGATTVFDRQYFINLFSTADKSTLMHEMAHAWLSEINYFASAKNATAKVLDIKKQLDNWLGVPDNNGRYSTEQQEQFAQNFEVYLKEGKAPTAKLKTVFARFKTWLSEIYDRIKDDLPKINDDVRELFDSILSRSYDVPDSNIYAGKEKAIKEVIKNIQEGKASEVDGITIDDVYNLLNVAYTRKPSKPSKNLKQLLNDKNIYDFNELTKAGADTVLQILKDGGYVKEDATTEQALELARQVLDGKPIYRLADQWRVAGDIDFARNLRVLEKVIEFSQIDSTLEKILSLQQEGYRNVEQSDVDKVQDEYKRLMSADVKEAKKIVEDIINRLHKKRFIDRAAQKQMIVDLNFSSTVEEIKESVLNVIEDLQDEIKLVKEQLRNPRKPIVRKDKTIPPGKNATEEEKNNYKKYMRKQINKLLKQALPRKQNQQKFSKFDMQTQRFFTDLEKYNKMTIEAAQEELYKRATSIIDDEGVGLDNFEKMKNMFLSYKANKINQNSVEFYKQLYDNLQEINVFGRNAKDIENTLKKEQIQQDINSLVVNIEDNKSKNKGAAFAKKWYVLGLGNWWSTINAIAGKKQADKDSMEKNDIINFTEEGELGDDLKTKCAAAWGFKNTTDLDMTVYKSLNEEYTYEELDPASNTRNAVKLNKLQLMHCYIDMKNTVGRERIVRAYGNEQIADMMNKLTIQDKKCCDALQKTIADLYPKINKVYLRMYGLDMPQAENYFPFTPERIQGPMDLMKDNIGAASSPGFIKARVQSNLPLMNFGNPFQIALNHIAKVVHFVNFQEKLADLNKVYKATIVKRHITNAYGETVYKYIVQLLDNEKFQNVTKTIDAASSIGDYLTNNYVLTKIAVKPSIMIKQWVSCINYAEDMSTVQWFEGFLKGLSHPKKTIDFMMKNSRYCKQRFAKGGQTEALLKAMEGGSVTIAKVKTFKGMLSWMTRVGDIGAIVFGGYPYVMDQISKGVPLKTAIENFEKATIRSQQASMPSTLSNWQYRGMNNWLLRALFAFANTANQYSRKTGDTIYMYIHGDIDKKQLAKNLTLYGVLNPLMYTSLTSLAILSGLVSGDWDDLKDDIVMSLMQCSNMLSIPIIGQGYNYAVQRVILDTRMPQKEIPLLAEIMDIIDTLKKQEIETKDWLTIIDDAASLMFGVPVKTLYNTFVGSTKDLLDGEYGKFAVKLYGATESRANKIFD